MAVTKVKSKTKKYSKKFSKNRKNKSMKRNLSRKGRSMRGGAANSWMRQQYAARQLGFGPDRNLTKQQQILVNRKAIANLAPQKPRNPAGEAYLSGSRYGSRYSSGPGTGYSKYSRY